MVQSIFHRSDDGKVIDDFLLGCKEKIKKGLYL